MTSIVLRPLSSPLLSSVSVQLTPCPRLYCLSSTVLFCLCFFFIRILRAVQCVEFGHLSFFLHVQTIRVFTGRLCLAELFGISNVLVLKQVHVGQKSDETEEGQS